MPEMGRKFDQDFRESAVRLVRETSKPIAEVARDLGINEGTLGNWVNADKRRRGDGTGVLDEDERVGWTPRADYLGLHNPQTPCLQSTAGWAGTVADVG